MTHGEAFNLLDIALDKSQAPYYAGEEKEYLFYDALLEWLKLHYRDFEHKEKRREDLDLVLVRKYPFLAVSTIDLSAVPSFFLVADLYGKWDFACNGKTTERIRPIVPLRHDHGSAVVDDPFNVPNNHFPAYSQYHDGTKPVLSIRSDTPPKNGVLTYIMVPARILDSTPTAPCQLPDWAMHEVIRHATRIALGIVENMQRYQAQTTVEIPSVE